MERIVVIGGGAAGMSAASAARRVDEDLEVIVLEAGTRAAYGLCGLPYYLSHVVDTADSLRAYPPEVFRDKRNIDLRFETRALHIDTGRAEVHVRTGAGDDEVLAFDRLILAGGAKAVVPPIPGLSGDYVHVVRTVEDAVALRSLLDAGHVGRAVVIGGGYIGLEVTEALAERGIDVTLVEATDRLMGSVDPVISETIAATVREHATVHLSTAVQGVRQVDGGIEVDLDTGQCISSDVVIAATGVRPDTLLASTAGADTGPAGALLVDHRMETSLPGIFAAGDCIAPHHIVSGRPTYVPLGTTANKTGRVAGAAAAGSEVHFPGIAGTAAVKVFGLGVARTGLSLGEAVAAGFDAVAVDATGRSRAKYYPGSSRVDVRIVHSNAGQLLGAQFTGPADEVAKRVDVVAVALQAGMSVNDLVSLDLSYAPPFAPVYEPILLAAQAAERGLSSPTSAAAVR